MPSPNPFKTQAKQAGLRASLAQSTALFVERFVFILNFKIITNSTTPIKPSTFAPFQLTVLQLLNEDTLIDGMAHNKNWTN